MQSERADEVSQSFVIAGLAPATAIMRHGVGTLSGWPDEPAMTIL
jgi:hypothetical protein